MKQVKGDLSITRNLIAGIKSILNITSNTQLTIANGSHVRLSNTSGSIYTITLPTTETSLTSQYLILSNISTSTESIYISNSNTSLIGNIILAPCESLKFIFTGTLWHQIGLSSLGYVPYTGANNDVDLGNNELIANGGISVLTDNSKIYLATNCPVVYEGVDCYVPNDGDGDDGFSCLWVVNSPVYFDDSGVWENQALLSLNGEDTPTINVTVLRANFGSEEEPFYMYITGYHDMTGDDFAEYANVALGTGDLLENYHTEIAFTFNEVTQEYDTTTELAVCEPSAYTTWEDSVNIITKASGFTVSPVTADIVHIGNYTNNNEGSIFKTRGQIKAGNGNVADVIDCPIVSNPIIDLLSGDSGLKFAMTSVPEIADSTGTALVPVNRSVYVAGMYGTTSIGGENVRYGGTAIGGWCAIMNTSQGNAQLSKGVGIRAGMCYATGTPPVDLYIERFSCFQADFTNLNGGSSSHSNVILFEGTLMGNNVSAVNAYGLYLPDNSARATNAWGVYSLETNNYINKLFVGATAEKPNSTLQVKGSLSLAYRETDMATTLTDMDYTVNCTANSFTISLPTAVGIQGRIYNIKNTGTGEITIDANGTETIDGQLTQIINQWSNVKLQSTNAGWIIL